MKFTTAAVALVACISTGHPVEAAERRRLGHVKKTSKRASGVWTIGVTDEGSTPMAILHGDTFYKMKESGSDFHDFAQQIMSVEKRRQLNARKRINQGQRKLTKASRGNWDFDTFLEFAKFHNGVVSAYTPDDDGVCSDTECSYDVRAFIDTGDSNKLEIQMIENSSSASLPSGRFACPNKFDVMTLESSSCGIYDFERTKVQDCVVTLASFDPPNYRVTAVADDPSDLSSNYFTLMELELECNSP